MVKIKHNMRKIMIQIFTYMFASILALNINGCVTPEGFDVYYEASESEDEPQEEVEVPFREKTDTYYIDSENGNDANDGKSEAKAWKSLSKIAGTKLLAGDKVLLKRGCTFNEFFLVEEAEGSKKRQVVISTYGSGDKPKIVAPGNSQHGVQLRNCTYITVEELDIKNHGTDAELRDRTGINIHLEDFGTAYNIELKGLDVHDVNGRLWKGDGAGVAIRFTINNNTVTNWFDGVLIDGCTVKRCVRNAITFGGNYHRGSWYPHKNVVIRENLIEEVPGDGILVGQCDGALVEYNVMRNCTDPWGGEHNAAAGMWPWSSDNTVIQFNEVSGHKATWDGQGFDADYNCIGTIIRYNYSHDNYGGFLLICDDGSARKTYSAGNKDTKIYGNVSYNDGIRPYKRPKDDKWYSPGIHISGPVEDCEVYNNIIYLCERAADLPKQDKRFIHANGWAGDPLGVDIRNNLFYSKVRESNFETNSISTVKFTGNWYLGISPAAMGSSRDTNLKTENKSFETIMSKDTDARKALENGFLRVVKTKTATMITVDKDKLDKFFNNN